MLSAVSYAGKAASEGYGGWSSWSTAKSVLSGSYVGHLFFEKVVKEHPLYKPHRQGAEDKVRGLVNAIDTEQISTILAEQVTRYLSNSVVERTSQGLLASFIPSSLSPIENQSLLGSCLRQGLSFIGMSAKHVAKVEMSKQLAPYVQPYARQGVETVKQTLPSFAKPAFDYPFKKACTMASQALWWSACSPLIKELTSRTIGINLSYQTLIISSLAVTVLPRLYTFFTYKPKKGMKQMLYDQLLPQAKALVNGNEKLKILPQIQKDLIAVSLTSLAAGLLVESLYEVEKRVRN